MDSILNSIKNQLQIELDDDSFDNELILDINSELTEVTHLGVGCRGFFITGDSETWLDFECRIPIQMMLREYIYLQVKKVFDSESVSSSAMDSITRKIERLEIKMRDCAEGDFE